MKIIVKISILLTIIFGLFLTSCDKNIRSAELFKIYMTIKGFSVTEHQISEGGENIVKKSYIANNGKFMIMFYETVSLDDAKMGFSVFKNETIAKYDIEKAVVKNNTTPHSDRYTLLVDGHYILISRTDNTFMFSDSLDIYKDDLIKIAKNLGY